MQKYIKKYVNKYLETICFLIIVVGIYLCNYNNFVTTENMFNYRVSRVS